MGLVRDIVKAEAVRSAGQKKRRLGRQNPMPSERMQPRVSTAAGFLLDKSWLLALIRRVLVVTLAVPFL